MTNERPPRQNRDGGVSLREEYAAAKAWLAERVGKLRVALDGKTYTLIGFYGREAVIEETPVSDPAEQWRHIGVRPLRRMALEQEAERLTSVIDGIIEAGRKIRAEIERRHLQAPLKTVRLRRGIVATMEEMSELGLDYDEVYQLVGSPAEFVTRLLVHGGQVADFPLAMEAFEEVEIHPVSGEWEPVRPAPASREPALRFDDRTGWE